MTYHKSNIERLNKRDLRYNNQHRTWGKTLYMNDADSIEYDSQGNPVAIIELKHGKTNLINTTDYQFTCLKNLANRLQVPLFLVVYFPTGDDLITNQQEFAHWQFYVNPINSLAQAKVSPQQMTEKQYVKFLYYLRVQDPPTELLPTLDDTRIAINIPIIN